MYLWNHMHSSAKDPFSQSPKTPSLSVLISFLPFPAITLYVRDTAVIYPISFLFPLLIQSPDFIEGGNLLS